MEHGKAAAGTAAETAEAGAAGTAAEGGEEAASGDAAGSPGGLANGAIPPSNATDNHPLVFVGTNMESARPNPSEKKPQLR